MTNAKRNIMAFKIISILFAIAIVVCGICDFVIHKRFVWAGIPAVSILFAWILISVPLLIKKRKIIFTLVAFSISLYPYLFLLSLMTPYNNWQLHIGLPITLVMVGAIWATYFLIWYRVLSKWYLAGTIIFLYGVIVNLCINYFASRFTGTAFIGLDTIINTLVCLGLAVIFFLIGFKGKNKISDELKEDEQKETIE